LKKKAREPFSEEKMKERIRTETFFAKDENKMISIERANGNSFEKKNGKDFFSKRWIIKENSSLKKSFSTLEE